MIYLKFAMLWVVDILVTVLTAIPAAFIVSAFTREQPHGSPSYTWGWLWGTYDNPPQGDEGFVRKRAVFPEVTTGVKGYINRVMWMLRNPLYGLANILPEILYLSEMSSFPVITNLAVGL